VWGARCTGLDHVAVGTERPAGTAGAVVAAALGSWAAKALAPAEVRQLGRCTNMVVVGPKISPESKMLERPRSWPMMSQKISL